MFKLPFYPDRNSPVTATPIIRTVIEASKHWFETVGGAANIEAERIIERNSGSIRQFWVAQSQNYQQGVGGVCTTHLRLQEVDLLFQQNNGIGILTVTVRPENVPSGGSTREFNYDGYITFITIDKGAAQVDYEFYLNDQNIGHFSTNEKVAIIFTFGSTALKCQSLLAKDVNPNKPLVGKVLPARPKIDAFKNINNDSVPKEDDLLMYPMYNLQNSLIRLNEDYTGPPIDDTPTPSNFVIDTKYLNSSGLNKFRVKITSDLYPANNIISWVLFSEFYSRNSYRKATQSWTKVGNGNTFVVNDEPLRWAVFGDEIYPDLAIDVDLTSQKVDRTTPTPLYAFKTDPSSGLSIGGDTPNTGSVMPYARGYWRLGDPPSKQPITPGYPWDLAIVAAEQVVATYQTASNMLPYFAKSETYPPGYTELTAFVVTGLSAADDVLTSSRQSYNTTNAFYADGSVVSVLTNALTSVDDLITFMIGVNPITVPPVLITGTPAWINALAQAYQVYLITGNPHNYDLLRFGADDIIESLTIITPLVEELNQTLGEMNSFIPI